MIFVNIFVFLPLMPALITLIVRDFYLFLTED